MSVSSTNFTLPNLNLCVAPGAGAQSAPVAGAAAALAAAPTNGVANFFDSLGQGVVGLAEGLGNGLLGLGHVVLDAIELPLEALNNAIPLPAGADESLANPVIPGLTHYGNESPTAPTGGSAPAASSTPAPATSTSPSMSDQQIADTMSAQFKQTFGYTPEASTLKFYTDMFARRRTANNGDDCQALDDVRTYMANYKTDLDESHTQAMTQYLTLEQQNF